jgi:hypothetical protein
MSSSEVPLELPARVHFVRVPDIRLDLRPARWVVPGMLLAWLVAFGALMGVSELATVLVLPFGEQLPDALQGGVLFTILFGAGVGPFAFFWWVDRTRQHRCIARTQQRHERLVQLVADAGASGRLFRILVRLTYRRHMRSAFQPRMGFKPELQRVLAACGPGATMIVSGRKAERPPLPVPTDAGFEPLNLVEPNEQLDSLLRNSYPGVGRPGDLERGRAGRRFAGIKRRWRLLGPDGGPIARWAWLGVMVWLLLLPGPVPGVHYFRLFIAGVLLWVLLPALCGGRAWWLVPGGLVYRDHRLWRKRVRVGRVTRADSSVVIDLCGVARILCQGRMVSYRWGGQKRAQRAGALAAFLAAWVSLARTPTREEVLAFMGPDAEWDDGGGTGAGGNERAPTGCGAR